MVKAKVRTQNPSFSNFEYNNVKSVSLNGHSEFIAIASTPFDKFKDLNKVEYNGKEYLSMIKISVFNTLTINNQQKSLIISVIKEGNLITELDKPFGSFFIVSFEISITKLPEESNNRNVFTVITKYSTSQ